MEITNRMRDAVTNALGYTADDGRIRQALVSVPFSTVEEAEEDLEEKCAIFEAAGGRGLELADRIDDLRIFIVCCTG